MGDGLGYQVKSLGLMGLGPWRLYSSVNGKAM